ncbi:hypothetical protein GmHk_07G019646 [Glycine max]|nr:hypothetical protein GmHk_07G019646 [Glycine max]
MGTQRILVSDHTNGYQYSTEEVDSIVIDMDSFSSGINKDITKANFRIITSETLIKVTKTLDLRSCTAEKSVVVTVGSTHHSTNTQVHHHITIIASNMSTTTTLKESKYVASKICVLSFFFLVFRAGNKMMMRMVHLPVKAPQDSENSILLKALECLLELWLYMELNKISAYIQTRAYPKEIIDLFKKSFLVLLNSENLVAMGIL